MDPAITESAIWIYRAALGLAVGHVLLSTMPRVRQTVGVTDRMMSCGATVAAPLFGLILGFAVRGGSRMSLLRVVGAASTDALADQAAFSPHCTAMAGMSIMVYLTFAIVIYERLLRDTVLPWAFSWFWGDLTPEKQRKMVGCLVALNVRLAGLIALLPSFVSNFDMDGLVSLSFSHEHPHQLRLASVSVHAFR
eukprot:m.134288 g.134288  ORF g.134288 m.134288 type:complete len:194 (+) comp13859_c0_seq8:195-776(+)